MEHEPAVRANANLDPFEWAILSVVIAGTSLIFTIKQKIKDQKKETSEKARRGNQLRLQELRECLKDMGAQVERFRDLVELRIDSTEPGVTRGSWEFRSPQAMEEFNRSFDRITYLISRLNRCVNGIDADGISLSEKDTLDFVTSPMRRIAEAADKAIAPSTHPTERLELVKSILYDAERLLERLQEASR